MQLAPQLRLTSEHIEDIDVRASRPNSAMTHPVQHLLQT